MKFKNMEWCKKLLIGVEFMILGIFVLVIVSTIEGDMTPLVALITGVFSLASISYGFYFWKAKNENIRKYGRRLSNEEIDRILKYSKGVLNDENIQGNRFE